jgi:hypothetical protein
MISYDLLALSPEKNGQDQQKKRSSRWLRLAFAAQSSSDRAA